MEQNIKKTASKTTGKTTSKATSKAKATEEVKVEPIPQSGGRLSKKKNKNLTINIEDKTREVPVVSVVSYGVGYNCKEKNMFLKWNEYGDEHMMSIQEVLNMNGESNMFLHDPCLLVDDEEVATALGLTEMYELIFEIEDLESFYSQTLREIDIKLDKLPNELRKNLLARTITMISQGLLSNLDVVRLLKNKYKIEVEI